MMRMEYPWLLLLFIPYAAVLYFGWTRRTPSIRVPGLAPFRQAVGRSSRPNLRKLIPFVLYALGGAAIILALTRPREGIEEHFRHEIDPASSEGIDIMIAIDISPSMEAYDSSEAVTRRQMNTLIREGKVENRFDTAKDEIKRFIEGRPGDRIGLIVFSALPYVICPPTIDKDYLLSNLERLSIQDWYSLGNEDYRFRGGTGIARPIVSAVDRLKNSEGKSRVVVFFTDGADNADMLPDPPPISPRDAGRLARKFDVKIYTVGIGSHSAWLERMGFLERYADEFDEPLMKDLAEITGGRYYHASDSKGMALAMDEINKLEKTEFEQPIEYSFIVSWHEFYPYLCWFGLGAILLAFCLGRTFCLRLP